MAKKKVTKRKTVRRVKGLFEKHEDVVGLIGSSLPPPHPR